LSVIVHGLIERFVRQDARPKWDRLGEEARLAEDLGVDSLTILEIVCRAEEGFQVSIDNEEIRALRTVGEFKRFIIAKLEKKSRALRESACTHSAHGPAPSFVYFPGKDTLGARWVAFPATGVPACPPVASGTAKPGNDLSGPSGGISGPKHLC
jgi:acyl carrier protein